jgi:hypothetical protein
LLQAPPPTAKAVILLDERTGMQSDGAHQHPSVQIPRQQIKSLDCAGCTRSSTNQTILYDKQNFLFRHGEVPSNQRGIPSMITADRQSATRQLHRHGLIYMNVMLV